MKLTKKQLAERDEIINRLAFAYDDLAAAVDTYNTQREPLLTALTDALGAYNDGLADLTDNTLTPCIDAYNEVLSEARQWTADIITDLSDDIDNKSDKRRESERGQAAEAMRDQYDSIDLEDVSIETPDPLEIDDPGELMLDLERETHTDLLEQLPEGPEA